MNATHIVKRSVPCPIIGIEAWEIAGETPFFYVAPMSIDADGAPNAYHPTDDKLALDNRANAEYNDILAADPKDGSKHYIQNDSELCPGFLVAKTALSSSKYVAEHNPKKYLDSTRVPYISLPGNFRPCTKGDFVAVHYLATQQRAFAIYGDVGPAGKLGEASIALAKSLGVTVNGGEIKDARQGVEAAQFIYVVFRHSHDIKPWDYRWEDIPSAVARIQERGAAEFANWGGLQKLQSLYPKVTK